MSLEIYKRGATWHYRGTIKGQRLRGTTGSHEEKDARRIADEIASKAWTLHLDGPREVLTFSAACELYLDAGKSDQMVALVAGYWKDTLVKDINSAKVRQLAAQVLPDAKGSSRNTLIIIPTSAIINHAAKQGLCDKLYVEKFKSTAEIKEPATWLWVQAFMKACGRKQHLAALCCFLFLTGCRISEALAVRWKDVDLEAQKVRIDQTKVAAKRTAHLPPELIQALTALPSNRNPEARVFRYKHRNSVTLTWLRMCTKANIPELSPHECRHGFATTLLRRGVDVVTVAKLGGWADPTQVLRTYGHALDDLTLVERLTQDLTDTSLTQEAAE